MCKVNRSKNSSCIIRIYVADESGFHLECVICLSPVLKCNVKSTRTKVTSADTDLNNSGELLPSLVCDLPGMNLVCKISSLLLLCNVEFTFVYTIYNNRIAQLSACQVMKDHTVLTCIDHSSVI